MNLNIERETRLGIRHWRNWGCLYCVTTTGKCCWRRRRSLKIFIRKWESVWESPLAPLFRRGECKMERFNVGAVSEIPPAPLFERGGCSSYPLSSPFEKGGLRGILIEEMNEELVARVLWESPLAPLFLRGESKMERFNVGAVSEIPPAPLFERGECSPYPLSSPFKKGGLRGILIEEMNEEFVA
jgi:hypothetical protein